MTSNDSVQYILEKIVSSKLIAGSTHYVDVTHVKDPKDFYVRLASIGEEIKTLEVQGNPITAKDLYIGKQVIYKSKIQKRNVRGLISGIKEENYNIFAMDYGCSDMDISLKDIYTTQTKLQCPALAIQCQLSLCEPFGRSFSNKAIDAMRYFVGEYPAQITIMSICNRKLTVELVTEECPGGVAKLLAMLNYTALGCCVNTVSRLTDSPLVKPAICYKYKKFQVGDRLHARVMSGEKVSAFYVAEINEYKKYVASKGDFTNYCKQQKNVDDVAEAAVDKRCCGVKLRHCYERAIVLRVTDTSKATVKLVDLGGEYETSFDCIQSVTSKCYNARYACAIYCCTSEDQIWNNGLPKFLYPGFELIIEIVEVGNERDVPHKSDVLELLFGSLIMFLTDGGVVK